MKKIIPIVLLSSLLLTTTKPFTTTKPTKKTYLRDILIRAATSATFAGLAYANYQGADAACPQPGSTACKDPKSSIVAHILFGSAVTYGFMSIAALVHSSKNN